MAVVALMALGACTSPRSFDRALEDQDSGYLDDATPAERLAAANIIGASLLRGVGAYRLQPGDRVDVTYHFDNQRLRAYRLGIGDELDLDFAFDRSLNRTIVVRPDGMISVPAQGELRALGTTPAQLSRAISRRYADVAQDPVVTVIVRRFTTSADDLAEVVRNGTEGRTRSAVVRPDGLLDLPLVQGLRAAGRTPEEVRTALDEEYDRAVGGVRTTVRVSALGANQIFVFGEVRSAGAIPAPTPRTVLQTLAAAGGPMPTAAVDQIRVLYFDPAGRGRVRQVNLNHILEQTRLGEDMIVPPNSTVYVPPTQVARAGRWVDQVIRGIFLFNGSSVSLSYGVFSPTQR
jgi:polysaccharide export outer membrane protein